MKMVHPNGHQLYVHNYSKGKPNGQQSEWYPDGVKRLEGEFQNGLYIGHWTWWYPDSTIALKGNFSLGNPLENWVWIDPDGLVETIECPGLKWVENQIQIWEKEIKDIVDQ